MILAAYVDTAGVANDEDLLELPYFEADTVAKAVVNATLSIVVKKPEVLVFFDKDNPGKKVSIPVGAVILGEIFVMDKDQRELFPLLQQKRRSEAMSYIKGLSDDVTYEEFLQIQRKAFEGFLLPWIAPMVLKQLSGEEQPFYEDAKLTPGELSNLDKDASFDKVADMFFRKGLYGNDACWCQSGKKYKNCHGK